jgi:hypothetical protein
MSWLRRKWDRWRVWRMRKPCRHGDHDFSGPYLSVTGQYVWLCRRCPYRFRATRVRVY